MKVGSVVKLSRPYSANKSYKYAIGIVEDIRSARTEPNEFICRVRFLDICYPAIHKTLEVFQHRLDLLEE